MDLIKKAILQKKSNTMQHIRKLQIGLSIFATALLAIHLVWPVIKIDAIAVSLLLIAILPWLAPLIKSVELPGVGKLEFQELKEKVAEVQGAAQSAIQKSEFASAEKSDAPAGNTSSSNNTSTIPNISWANNRMLELAKEYNETRGRMRSGDARTVAMTAILRRMVDAAAGLADYDVANILREKDKGLRLTAYAYLFSHPKFSWLAELVDSLVDIEDTPFGQYWALQALGKVLSARRNNQIVDGRTLTKLKHLYSTLQIGTDRHYELGRIVRGLESV